MMIWDLNAAVLYGRFLSYRGGLIEKNTKRYGVNSITNTCICNWKTLTKEFNFDLFTLTRYQLKKGIKTYFLQSLDFV